MDFIRNFPFFSIIICMFSGIISSVLDGKRARNLCFGAVGIVTVLSMGVLFYTVQTGEAYTYMMGHFPAPWGNEIRAGILEGILAVTFSVILLLSLVSAYHRTAEDIEESKLNLFYVLVDLLLSSLLAIIYTNDLFTAYVFVEINTIAACGLIMIRQIGRTFGAAIKYMVMSLVGSGLFLIGLSLLYTLTGHLLMSPAKEAMQQLIATDSYHLPVLVILVLMSIGLAIKSGLYPFHSWMPDAYGFSTASASAILSGLVSKAYIILLIKIFYRVVGIDFIVTSEMMNVLFVFGLVGMIMGSVSAILEKDIRRMIAFSSVAQIGYIYMGIGLGIEQGYVAAVYHILHHAATKALLFISVVGLSNVSGGSKQFPDLRGAGYRHRSAGVAFTVGSFSMVGLPMFSGFISKYLFATAALWASPKKVFLTLVVLSVSTILNAIYFIHTVVTIYTPAEESEAKQQRRHWHEKPWVTISLVIFIGLNFVLGIFSQPVVDLITSGLRMFG
jgi:multicomponent Na+:H+ antiporter subunit D